MKARKCGLNLAYTGTIKDEILDAEEIAFNLLKYLLKEHKEKLCPKYKLDQNQIQEIQSQNQDENQSTMEILEQIGRKRGALISRTEK